MEEKNKKISFREFKNSYKIIKAIIQLLIQVSKKYLFYNIAIAIVVGIIPIISIIISQQLMNEIQLQNNNIRKIIVIFAIMIIFGIVSTLIRHFQSYISAITQGYVGYKINTQVMQKASELKLKDYENSEIYDMVKRADTESAVRPYVIFSEIMSLVTAIVTLISSLGILIAWKWWSVFIFALVPTITSKYFVKIGKEEQKVYINKTKNERQSWYISFLLTKDQTIKELKINSLTSYLVNMFETLKCELFKENIKLSKKRNVFGFIFEVISFIISNFIIFLAIVETYMGNILIGTLMAIMKTTSIVDSNLKGVTTTIFSLYEDSLYAKHIIDFLNIDTNNEDIKLNSYEEIDEIRSIKFVNISYKYDKSNRYSLRNINLEIKKGDKVILVGENGSGKSTLVKILTGLYDDYEGDLYINDINVKNIKSEIIKEKLAVVFQDYVEYQTTIRENIGFGNIKKINDDNALLIAAEKADANGYINNLDKKLETQVGCWFEGGVQLSGGQWQKLAIARAFVKDADMYILDEPSAALDPLSEYELFKNLTNLTKDKIAIFITHRFTNAKFSNKIVVLDDGEIIEVGKHEQLINKNGKYRKLFMIQQCDSNMVSVV